jgi:hypothetical protein
MPNLRFALLASFVLIALITGCGPQPEKLVPVSGKITIQGEPLPYGRLALTPGDGNTTKSQPIGKVQDGTYTLETDGKPGAPVGAYRVAIFAIKESTQADGYKPPVWAASQEYSDPSKSGIILTVFETPSPNVYDIVLTKK